MGVIQNTDTDLLAPIQIRQQQEDLQKSHGVLREVASFQSSFETPRSGPLRELASRPDTRSRRSSGSLNSRKTRTSPRVVRDGVTHHEEDSIIQQQHSSCQAPHVEHPHLDSSEQSSYAPRLQICQTSTPMTPSLDCTENESETRPRQYRRLRDQRQVSGTDARTHSGRRPRALSPQPEGDMNISISTDDDYSMPEKENLAELSGLTQSQNVLSVAAVEGSIADLRQADHNFAIPPVCPRPAVLDTAAAQDMSLPSPSLSPVTAAASLQHRRGYFEDTNFNRPSRSLNFAPVLDGSQRIAQTGAGMDCYEGAEQACRLKSISDTDSSALIGRRMASQQLPSPTLMDIPLMLDSFDGMPPEMKSYVMYQLLRRCPKPILHFVADVVNPTLKCDFLNLLPLELGQTVLGYLDVKSLCRAAQVSRKWRHVVNSDEKAWKRLFDVDGFILPEGELSRAILEGWGWQYGSGGEDWEKDIGNCSNSISRNKWSSLHADADILTAATSGVPDTPSHQTQNKRQKRKAAGKSKPSSRKHQKRKENDLPTEARFDRETFMKHMADGSEGPYAAANEAAIAVPFSDAGLNSLRGLHLFKSIYQRHYLIRKNWMQDEIKPRHIAFKAHQRHVVTCLQFDPDKIITGSDDTNINVYNTRTGALQAKLEGHEGGVWALQYEGNMLVSGSTDRSVRVWDIEKGVCTQVFQGHTSTVRCLQILMPTTGGIVLHGEAFVMPKQPLIITGSRDSNLRVWKLPNQDDPTFPQAGQSQEDIDCPYFVRTLTGHHHSVRAIAAHHDTLVSGSYDCTVRVWKISTGETVHQLRGHTQKVYSVVLDHQRNRCISGSMDNLVKVWSLDTGSLLFNLEGHSSLVGLLDLQQDRLVSAAADSTLRIWDPDNGHCKSTLEAHTGAITCFQHDSQKVISGSDRTLKMWNVRDGILVRDLLTDLSGVWQVKFDERRCVAAVQRNHITYIEVSCRADNKFYLALHI